LLGGRKSLPDTNELAAKKSSKRDEFALSDFQRFSRAMSEREPIRFEPIAGMSCLRMLEKISNPDIFGR
jgi:hypothetical protein